MIGGELTTSDTGTLEAEGNKSGANILTSTSKSSQKLLKKFFYRSAFLQLYIVGLIFLTSDHLASFKKIRQSFLSNNI